jgi:hypothetical protein
MLAAFAFTLMASVGPSTCLAQTGKGNDNLAGAWQGRVQFTTGAFADTKDLEFMYAFNSGGTMTESSNYDAAPPAPPADGNSFDSRITLELFGKDGNVMAGGGEATASAISMQLEPFAEKRSCATVPGIS